MFDKLKASIAAILDQYKGKKTLTVLNAEKYL